MRAKLSNKIVNLSNYLTAAVLVLVPFQAFITVWLGSNFGYYTLIRLWVEIVLMILTLSAITLLILDKKLAKSLFQKKWFWLIIAFFLLEIIWGVIAYLINNVSAKALGYAWVADSRYLLFFVIVYLLAAKSNFLKDNWRKLIFIPAAIVAAFAILQFFVLPLNFLTHFGYGPHTIFPYETINHNKNYIRAMSFTRGANPLGAYMIIVIGLAVILLAKVKNKLAYAASSVLALAALVFSFSRSAWLGAVVSLVLLAFIIAKARARKIMLVGGALVIIILIAAFASLHNNSHFQNYIYHTQDNSTIKTNSDTGHLAALENGFDDFTSEPFGRGPGTSGPASVYNNEQPVRNTENYYLMIGGEDGWLGLALLLAIFAFVAIELKKQKSKLALGLFTSFIGLAAVNLLLPAWTDVTLAFIFWGLVGITLAGVQSKHERKTNIRNNPADKKAA